MSAAPHANSLSRLLNKQQPADSFPPRHLPLSDSQDPAPSPPPLSVVQSVASEFAMALPASSTAPAVPPSDATTPWEDLEGEEKRCWICFVEEREEIAAMAKMPSAGAVRWVTPCRCKNSLKVDACFDGTDRYLIMCMGTGISAISEKEGPATSKVKCPACGHPYTIEEPRDLLLSVFGYVDQAIQSVVPYVTLTGVSLAFYVVSTTFGAYAVMTICGPEQGDQILNEHAWGWRTWIGLPLIPITLVCSRLTAADTMLPLLPFLVIGDERIRVTFPPSPSFVVCLLPWARYNFCSAFCVVRLHLQNAKVAFPPPPPKAPI
ncbi:hypothetical protein BDK51DRAFT_31958 [Blyttiomyces helicus]|uniref:RING-CH-type domain-containing protein n=1 Tax=Blyttiomyces helicus TaxID=388810 RepID=A0A4P9W497_9FUNG|nr:hypothetical protein BDK51DRAFT_31958 [Blyttiomyces helicus]|eukprot:RKO86065.1 hypothetical protein BDK51DRAFT_31958 [Blyttiomyces helicus]